MFKSIEEKNRETINKVIRKYIVNRQWEAAKNDEDFYIDDEYIQDIVNRVMYGLKEKLHND